jgi:hypothetical protein
MTQRLAVVLPTCVEISKLFLSSSFPFGRARNLFITREYLDIDL